ncbi:inactive tyrosine-protein kinase PRAG1 [Erinaceus europaeus]|uniref:Inactive tyrosine-protein kinase PRAG1 n=1 Tax=Erinaceus europaeus TaxID=9365 RepID=A0A1S2ZIT9_ERIEU|nr:inactive tyrosine-protein kinase PRAG1 [Erinaceus europaeus]
MHQTIRLNPEGLKMSACSDFVEHIWKPGSCKNCFCLRSDHQLAPGHSLPRTGNLPPPPRLPPRPEVSRLEDEGVNSSPYSKPTIAVKPTMMNSETSDVWTEANMSAEVSQVIWRRAPGKLPIPKQEDVPIAYLGNVRGIQKPAGPPATTDGQSRCPPAYTMISLHSLEARGERSTAFHPLIFHDEKAGREDKPTLSYPELPSTQDSFRQKLATFAGMTSVCHKGPGPYPSPQPLRESLPSEDDCDQRCSPSGDSEGGEYCSILDCCPGSPVAKDAAQTEGSQHRHGRVDCPPICWGQGRCSGPSEEEKQTLNFPRECCGQGSTENVPHLGPKKPSLTSEMASSSDGLSCGSGSSGTSSPFAPHLESDYCSLMKEPTLGKQQDSSNCHGVTSSKCHGLSGEPQTAAQPKETVQPEPIYAESTKRKKSIPAPSRPQAKAEQPTPAQGQSQIRTANTWAQKTASGWGQGREGPDMISQVAATITVMAAHPEEDHRTIYLSSPDSAVGVQWPHGPVSQDSEAGEETSTGQGHGSREDHRPDANENSPKRRPAIPPKLSKSSPGGSPVSPSTSPLSKLSEVNSSGSIGPQLPSRVPSDPASSCRANGVTSNDSIRCPPPATSASTLDQRRPRYQTGAWNRQCRIEEEEEVEQELLSQSWGSEMENGTPDPSSSSTWHRIHPTDSSSEQNIKVGTGMSKSASFAFEFPKDRSGIETFSPPPPPPKSRHLLKMNKSSSDLEKVSQGSAESLSPSFRGIHVSFTTGSTDSLASDTRTCSDGGPSSEPAHSPTSSGKKLFAPVPFPSGSTEDVSPGNSQQQPPPLPQKKIVSRAASSPDGFFWTQGSPKPRTASPKLNLSHSETNVCVHEESPFSYSSSPGSRHHHIFSSEPLEKAFKGNGHWVPPAGLLGSKNISRSSSLQNKGAPSASSSQLSVSSQASSSSTQLQLHSLLSSISSKEGTYAKLGGLYAQSLVRLVAKCEDLFMGGQKKELHFNENNWSLFKLTCNKPCCDSGDAIYYCATCSEDPGNTYAVKICKTPEPKTSSYCSPSVPVHFNIQQDCGHFVASVPSSMLTSPDTLKDPPPALPSQLPAQEQDCVVVITREVPHQTASDFVRDSVTSHQCEPEVYERRVCFLLLQLCNGLEHLKEHGIIHRDLCLENLLLVHCIPQTTPGPSAATHCAPVFPATSSASPISTSPVANPSAPLPTSGTPCPPGTPACQGVPPEKHLPRLIISNFLKAKQKPGSTTNLQQKKSQARLAPEIVSASQYRKFDEFQTGILIYELLHQPNPFEVRAQLREQDYRQEDLPPLPTLSLYSPGLQQLAHLLLEADPIKRICIGEAKHVLQCLLWGPRRELVEQPGTSEEALCSTLHNWIDMKRALMMMKFAEKAVDRRRGVELEDWLCCQYLASAEPGALLQSLKLLQLL